MPEAVHTFAGNPLDRGDALRRDEAWLASAARDGEARYLPMWRLNALVALSEGGPRLGWLAPERVAALGVEPPPVFLGLADGAPRFGQDVSSVANPAAALALPESYAFEDCRIAGARLAANDAGILAQCRAQIGWHERHRFCSVCGARSRQARGGHMRICTRCGAQHFPRTDPVAIMVVTDGDRCLLGQGVGRLARSGMYSALAGFIDQGESIEEAVRREVLEEAGIRVGAVRYHSSQPWPFPSSLMIGCHGEALSTDIRIDPEEMADVRWFDRNDVKTSAGRRASGLEGPRPGGDRPPFDQGLGRGLSGYLSSAIRSSNVRSL